MAQFQANFEINDSTYLMIQEGLLRYSGGVIRWASGPHKGEIYEHIQFTDMKKAEEAAAELKEGVIEKAVDLLEENKKAVGVVAIGTVMALIGVGVYKWYKNRIVKEFNKNLKAYITAINEASMEESIIDALSESIDKLKNQKNYQKIRVSMSVFEIEALVKDIREYTYALAEANSQDVNSQIEEIENDDKIINLQEYLSIQKDILNAAL